MGGEVHDVHVCSAHLRALACLVFVHSPPAPNDMHPGVSESVSSPQQPWLADLYRTHFTSLVRAVALMGAPDPEDVVAEAMMRVLANQHRIREPEAVAGYLRRTTINLASNRMRSRRSEQAALARLGSPAETTELTNEPADTATALAILALPMRSRQVLVLRYWLDLPDSEIADLLGIRPATVRSHLTAARAALRQTLTQDRNTHE